MTPNLESKLAICDCIANCAYSLMLKKVGLLTDEEFALVKEGLKELSLLASHGHLSIQIQEANPFKPIDSYLKEKLNSLAIKLESSHTPLERGFIAIRLLWRECLIDLITSLIEIIKHLCRITVPIYLLKDTASLKDFYQSIDSLPEKSMESLTAGLDWPLTAALFGFSHQRDPMMENSHIEDCLGHIEAELLFPLVQIMNDILKICTTSSFSIKFDAEFLDSLSTDGEIIASCLFDALNLNSKKNENSFTNFQILGFLTLTSFDIIQNSLDKFLKKLSSQTGINKNLPDSAALRKRLNTYAKWQKDKRREWERVKNALLA